MIDCYDGMVVAHTVGTSPNAEPARHDAGSGPPLSFVKFVSAERGGDGMLDSLSGRRIRGCGRFLGDSHAAIPWL